MHFRNVRGKVPNYHETFVDDGDIDMAEIVRILRDEGYDGAIIPDHTPEMSCDAPWHAGKAFALGYMRALVAERRGAGTFPQRDPATSGCKPDAVTSAHNDRQAATSGHPIKVTLLPLSEEVSRRPLTCQCSCEQRQTSLTTNPGNTTSKSLKASRSCSRKNLIGLYFDSNFIY